MKCVWHGFILDKKAESRHSYVGRMVNLASKFFVYTMTGKWGWTPSAKSFWDGPC